MVEESDKGAVVTGAKDSTVGNEEIMEEDAAVSTDDAVSGETEDEVTASVASSMGDVVTSGSLSMPKVAAIAYCVVDGSEVRVVMPTVAPDASIN